MRMLRSSCAAGLPPSQRALPAPAMHRAGDERGVRGDERLKRRFRRQRSVVTHAVIPPIPAGAPLVRQAKRGSA